MRKFPSQISRCLPHALACACALALTTGAQAATWTKLSNMAPGGAGTALLLTDGTVMISQFDSKVWYRLTPDAKGSYQNGTFSSMANMSLCRLYFTSQVLRDGNVWILGGEYTGATSCSSNWANTAEKYDTLANTWSSAATHPDSSYGDVPSMMLEGDKIMTGSLQTNKTWVYDIAGNTWSAGPSKAYNDRSDEEGWAKLHNGQIFVYDLFQSAATGKGYAEVWDPASNAWSGRSPGDGTAKGTLPALSGSAVGYEMGPTFALRDKTKKGSVFAVGATGHTALYQIGTNTFSAMPDLNDKVNGSNVLFGADDAPGSEMPSGHVIFAADTGPTNGTFSPPTHLFDFDPIAKTITSITSSFPDQSYLNLSSYQTQMLMLPNGQMLFSNSSKVMYVYTPDGSANKAAMPVFTSLQYNGDGTFTLTGKQLNGQSSGATYGDDAQMDENYPIVHLTDASSNVFYERSTNWSNVRTGDKKPETVDLTLNKGLKSAGNYQLVISGAGIQSKATCVVITSDMIAGAGSAGAVQTCN